MKLRSLLFVPGDRPDRIRKAAAAGADAIIIDLEDAVTPASKPAARAHTADFLKEGGSAVPVFVRVNPFDRDMRDEDLAAILPVPPAGVVLPKAEGRETLLALDEALSGTTCRILAIVTETPKAIFRIGDYGEVTDRLCGLTWGGEDLSAAVGASTPREGDGRYRPAYEMVRSLTLFGAHAANVAAIEAVYPDYRDLQGLAAYSERARQDGFSGVMAVHPSQIPVIHAAFQPSQAEIARAERIVALFGRNPGVGSLSLDGVMVDAPHLADARRLLKSLGA